jgi:hypothetical protein
MPQGQCRPGRSGFAASRLHESVPARIASRPLRLGPPRSPWPAFNFRPANFGPH